MEDKYIKIDLTEIDGKLIYKLNIIADRTDLLKYNLDTLKVFDDFIKVEADTSTGLAEIKASLNDEKISDTNYILSSEDFTDGYAIMRKGKKIYHKFHLDFLFTLIV